LVAQSSRQRGYLLQHVVAIACVAQKQAAGDDAAADIVKDISPNA
jgi:hypothetical protein